MKIPCVERLPFIVSGLAFLQPALTNSQFYNLTLIATALVLGSRFCLSEINRMWLEEKCISTLSHFMSHAKFSTAELQHLYVLQVMHLYKIKRGYFIIDDTMQHHTNYCKWIHGIFVLFDHTLKTNLKAICITVLYYSDGESVKFPIKHEIYYKETDNMPWQHGKKYVCIPKYDLAVGMLEWALHHGFPRCMVLADSWFGIGPFIKELQRLRLSYVVEIKNTYTVRMPCKAPKLTPTGKLAKNQYNLMTLPNVFKHIMTSTSCGFAANKNEGKEEKVIYHTKIITGRLNSIVGKHRIVQSIDPTKHTIKYFLTDQLTWEATKMISVYSHRWVIEEFFRNAKQLSDMEGATIRSEQGVTLALCLVSWIDSLLHFENDKRRTAGELSNESLTIPSIVRQAQYENLEAFVERVQNDEDFVRRWCEVEKKHISRKRKSRKELIVIEDSGSEELDLAA
jgi:hypothetical protein